MTAPTAIEAITLGIRIVTEFRNPTLIPRQVSPVHAENQAVTQASMLGEAGSARMLPSRISDIGFSDVITMT